MKTKTFIATCVLLISSWAQAADMIDRIELSQWYLEKLDLAVVREGTGFRVTGSVGYRPYVVSLEVKDASLVRQLDQLFLGRLRVASEIQICIDCGMDGVSALITPGDNALRTSLARKSAAQKQAIKNAAKYKVQFATTGLSANASPDVFERLKRYVVDQFPAN